jgi:uncharacterized repeat protein (TIGR02543 family)
MRKMISIPILIGLIVGVVLSSNVAYASATDEFQNLSTNSIHAFSTSSYLDFYESEANDATNQADLISNNFTGDSGYYVYGKINNYYFDMDYYKFTVPSDGQFDLKGIWLGEYYGIGWEDDLAIALEDQNGNKIAYGSIHSLSSGGQYRGINTFLKKGTYYIVALQSSSYQYLYVDESYGLIMNFTRSQIKTQFTVTFKSQGGSYVAPITAISGSKAARPTAPTRAGYTFGGWYTDSAYTNVYNFNTTVTSNVTLYAKWVVNPATPTAMKAITLPNNTNSISWGAVAGVKGYEVYRSTSSNGTYALVTTTAETKFNNSGLAANTVYYYKVRAYNVVGTVKAYSGFSAVFSGKPILSPPVNLKVVKATTSSIKITWNGATGATGYEIYRSMSSQGTYTSVKTVTTPSYTNTGLVKGKTYYYKVRAYKLVGTTKVYSGWTTVGYVKL